MTAETLQSAKRELRELVQSRSVRFGDFVLASGRRSSYFFQGKLVTLSAVGARLVGEVLFDRLKDLQIDAVGGKEMGANPIVTAISVISALHERPISGFIVRSRQKDHGMEELVAQAYADDGRPLVAEGRKVVIVDDVATTGSSCVDAVKAAQAAGCEVVKVIVLVDRQQGAVKTFADLGIPFEAIFVADEHGQLSDWRA